MKNNSIIKFSFILVISVILNCSDKSNEFFDPSYWSGPYKGITFTDQFGIQLQVDPDDWCLDYNSINNYSSLVPTIQGNYAFIPAYPNPVDREDGTINIVFYTKIESNIEISVKNQDYNIIKVLADGIYKRGLHELEWNLLNNLGNKVSTGIYRCYMYANNFSCYGDIWIK
jgi:hypothetical protein